MILNKTNEHYYRRTNKASSGLKLVHLCALVSYYAIKGVITKKKYGDEAYLTLMRQWGSDMMKAAKIDLIVVGKENIDPNEAYIYIANHSSLFDIPVLLNAIPDNIHFMYKKELEKVPILGFGLKYSAYIPIERDNPKDAMHSINMAVEAINNTGSVVLFPEGTRSKDGFVGQFKRGAFLIASKTKKKIVPVSIVGLDMIMPAKQSNLYEGKVFVTINSPIDCIPEDSVSMKKSVSKIHDVIAKQVEDGKKRL